MTQRNLTEGSVGLIALFFMPRPTSQSNS